MKSSLIWLVALSILLFSLDGCARRPPLIEQPPQVSFTEWLPALRERSEHWRSYQARVHIRAQTLEKKLNMNAVILAKLPNQFRLEAFRLGQTVGLLTMIHGQSTLFVPSEKVLYTASRSEVLIGHLFGISLPLDVFGYSLSASLPPDQLESLQIVSHDHEFIGFPKPSLDGWSYAWQFAASPQAVESARVTQEAWDYTIRYEPPVGLAVREVPQKITFTSPQWQIEVTVQEIMTAHTVQDSFFHNDFSGEILRVNLNSRE
jgi:outer membrane biogenesis lipoprotein LolB